MKIIILLFLAYTIISIVKVSWLFLNRNVSSPYFVLKPNLFLTIESVFYQPIVKAKFDLMEYRSGKTSSFPFLFSTLKFVIPLLLLSYILDLILYS